MKIFVWQGKDVLKNYRAGMAVVVASTAEDAWQKLKAADPRAYNQLQLGHWYASDETDLSRVDEDDLIPREGFPKQPEVFDLQDLPVLVITGGE